MSIEERLEKIEKELAEIKRRLIPANSSAEWLDNISGSMAAFPEFADVVRLGREIRKADVYAEPEEDS